MNKNDPMDQFLSALEASARALSKIIMKGARILASTSQSQYVELIASTFNRVMNDVVQSSRVMIQYERNHQDGFNHLMSMG